MSRVQVLASVMHQPDDSILEKLNIQSDAIIINQCDRNRIEKKDYHGKKVLWMDLAERGVGLSRNTAFMRADADICIFADDDEQFEAGYENMVISAFEQNKDADILLFYVPSENPKRQNPEITEEKRVHIYNCLRYGTFNIAVRTEAVRKKNIHFTLLFGGGTRYGSGEDSLFLADCLKAGLKIYTCPKLLAYSKQEESTWFQGYTEKFFVDKGALYQAISKHYGYWLCLQYALRHKAEFDGVGVKKAMMWMNQGRREWKKR